MREVRLSDIIQWDIRNWSQAIDFWQRTVDWSNVSSCLELGAHDGGLSLWLASKKKHVICSDLQGTKELAGDFHKKYDVDGRIEYADIDATSIPFENHFDVIVFKSMLGGIGIHDNKALQQTVCDQIHKALKPGGKLLFAENLVASGLHRFVRRKFIPWGTSWRYISIEETREFLRKFSRVDFRVSGVLGTFGRTERQRNLLSALDQMCVNHLTPARWKYLVYGTAEKQ
jgi:SAM-dependent methyltransferase